MFNLFFLLGMSFASRKDLQLQQNHESCTYSFETYLIDGSAEDAFDCKQLCRRALELHWGETEWGDSICCNFVLFEVPDYEIT